MINKVITVSVLASLLAFLSACATTSEQLDKKLSSENQVKSRADLRTEADGLIQKSKALSSDQKASLFTLRDTTKAQLDDIQKESLELRAVLIQDVLAANYNPKEVEKIKARMRQNENAKMAVIFSTVDQASKIIGRADVDPHEEMIRDFFIFDVQRGVY